MTSVEIPVSAIDNLHSVVYKISVHVSVKFVQIYSFYIIYVFYSDIDCFLFIFIFFFYITLDNSIQIICRSNIYTRTVRSPGKWNFYYCHAFCNGISIDIGTVFE